MIRTKTDGYIKYGLLNGGLKVTIPPVIYAEVDLQVMSCTVPSAISTSFSVLKPIVLNTSLMRREGNESFEFEGIRLRY